MTRGGNGLTTLLRWRELQQQIAEGEFHRESAVLVEARHEARIQEQALTELQRLRFDLQQAGTLDISVLEEIALIEDAVAQSYSDAAARLQVAETSTADALVRHVDARAARRVVGQRKGRADAQLRDANEKAISDQMSDMRTARGHTYD